jgi:hypothetical protein
MDLVLKKFMMSWIISIGSVRNEIGFTFRERTKNSDL